MIIKLSQENAIETIDRAINEPRGKDFYSSVRSAFTATVAYALAEQGLILADVQTLSKSNKTSMRMYYNRNLAINEEMPIDFFIKYGFDDYSLKAVNWQHMPYADLPCLRSLLECRYMSIGNFAFIFVPGKYEQIELDVDWPFNLVGYGIDIGEKKKKPNLCIFGVMFDQIFLQEKYELMIKGCQCEHLSKINLPSGFKRSPAYICNICGRLYAEEPKKTELQYPFRLPCLNQFRKV